MDPHSIENPPINLQLAVNTCGSINTSTDATSCGSCSAEVSTEKIRAGGDTCPSTCVARGPAILGQAARAGDLMDPHN